MSINDQSSISLGPVGLGQQGKGEKRGGGKRELKDTAWTSTCLSHSSISVACSYSQTKIILAYSSIIQVAVPEE